MTPHFGHGFRSSCVRCKEMTSNPGSQRSPRSASRHPRSAMESNCRRLRVVRENPSGLKSFDFSAPASMPR